MNQKWLKNIFNEIKKQLKGSSVKYELYTNIKIISKPMHSVYSFFFNLNSVRPSINK